SASDYSTVGLVLTAFTDSTEKVDKNQIQDKIRTATPESMPKWRNWQTRYVQGVVGARPCGFKSHLRHSSDPKRRFGVFDFKVRSGFLSGNVAKSVPEPGRPIGGGWHASCLSLG